MSNHKNYSLLIISDLHCVIGKINDDASYLSFQDGESEFASNLLTYLAGIDRKVDIIICPGDIANRAEADTFKLGWCLLNKIHDLFPSSYLLAVPGNHDHESQDSMIIDPKINMQFIEPRFPLSDFHLSTHFWAWNWANISNDVFNAIILNTSAYHGLANETLRHGRILPEIQRQILSHISSDKFPLRDLNLLICHHHPILMPSYAGNPDTEMAQGGQELVYELAKCQKGPWLVVHGHRHLPGIWFPSSSSREVPLIFSAGTLSAKLTGNLFDLTRNQFYFLDVDLERSSNTGIIVGTFETHEWTYAKGWSLSTSAYLPASGGFGNSQTPKEIVSKIVAHINGARIVDGKTRDLIENEIKYVTPDDIGVIIKTLKSVGIFIEAAGNKVIQAGSN